MDTSESVEVVETQVDNTEVETDAVETVEREEPVKTETPEQRVARLKRQLKREQQKLGIAEEEADTERSKPKGKPVSLGYAEKAFLNANGIKGKAEYDLVTEFVRNTGKELEEVVDSKFFQQELRSIREFESSRMASDAASGSKRGQQSAQDTLEYWLAKPDFDAKGNENLPPVYMTELRRQVVNARAAKHDTSKSPFLNR